VVGELRSKVEHDLADVAKATALIEGYKNPQAKGAAAKAVANFPFELATIPSSSEHERRTVDLTADSLPVC